MSDFSDLLLNYKLIRDLMGYGRKRTFYALRESGYPQVTGTYQVIDPITCNLRIPTR